MNRLSIEATPLPGVKLVRRLRLADDRGSLSRLFCAQELAPAGWDAPVAQVNHTQTRLRGTVRGMHYQEPPHAEQKLVSCLRGEVWDVALDLRRDSPTFLVWHACMLSADNLCALWLPEGVAHGFQALTDDAELLYCHSRAYVPGSERGVQPMDPRVGIRWPLAVTAMSERDRSFPGLTPDFAGVRP